MTWKGSIFQTVLFGKVFRSCLERRFRFMCQNSTIESLFGVVRLALYSSWSSTRLIWFFLVRNPRYHFT